MRYRDHILIGVFLVAISAPLAVQLAGNAASSAAHEKRKLATLPARPRSWTALKEYPGKFATYYGDRFGLRATLIRWHALAMYHVFRMSPTDKVLEGRDGWLFYADDSSLEDYRSLTPFTPTELERWRQVLEEQHDWLAARGITFVVAFACDKHVIYPEYLPAGYRRADQPYRVEVLADYLRKNSRLKVAALREPLLTGKATDRLYHKTDTHWNDRGAFIGYREIVQALGLTPLAYRQENVTTPGWDLARMMGLDDLIHEEDRRLVPVPPRRAKVVEEDRRDENWNQGRVALEVSDPSLPKAVMLRDSFGSALIPFLAEHFRRSVFLWRYDFAVDVIEQEKPDVVIWLMTSRRLQWYVPFNPPLPAMPETSMSPTFGRWKGRRPGDYVITKASHHEANGGSDRVIFYKTILETVTAAGVGCYRVFISDQQDGPWRGFGTHADAEKDATVRVKEFLPETITVGTNAFFCRTIQATITDDWGTKLRKQWNDFSSGLEIQSVETYEGQNSDGTPKRWKLTWRTVGTEVLAIGTEQIACLVQELDTSWSRDGSHPQYIVAPHVPGFLVAYKRWNKKEAVGVTERAAMAWGHDSGLLTEIKLKEGEDERRRQMEDEKMRERVDELTRKTAADLKNPDADKRLIAVRCFSAWPISERNKSVFLAGLNDALTDSDPRVRREAAWGLGLRGVKGLTEQILAMLKADPDGIYEYFRALGLQGDPKGLPTIIQSTCATNQNWRRAAVIALRHFPTKEARLALERAVNDPDWEIKFEAIQALEIVGDSHSAKVLVPVLRDENALVVRSAVRAIARLGDDNLVKPLLDLLAFADETVRSEICSHLGQMRLKDNRLVTDVLLRCLTDPSAEVQMGAISSLGTLRERRAVPLLVNLTRQRPAPSEDGLAPEPENMAILALGQIGDPPSVSRLIELLDDPQSESLAFRALAETSEAAAEPLLKRYIRTQVHSPEDKTLELLGQLGTRETMIGLTEYLTRCTPPEKAPIRRAIEAIQKRLSK